MSQGLQWACRGMHPLGRNTRCQLPQINLFTEHFQECLGHFSRKNILRSHRWVPCTPVSWWSLPGFALSWCGGGSVMGWGAANQRCDLIGLAFVIAEVDNYRWSEIRSTSVFPCPCVKHLPIIVGLTECVRHPAGKELTLMNHLINRDSFGSYLGLYGHFKRKLQTNYIT